MAGQRAKQSLQRQRFPPRAGRRARTRRPGQPSPTAVTADDPLPRTWLDPATSQALPPLPPTTRYRLHGGCRTARRTAKLGPATAGDGRSLPSSARRGRAKKKMAVKKKNGSCLPFFFCADATCQILACRRSQVDFAQVSLTFYGLPSLSYLTS